ncbi:MAG: H+/Na+-translocating ferredoxin:NAD+ oxidoreductase subunit [Clostridiales bacterium]|jgi:electron transport complex protein RnfC|nr:H+/Na+-translocating ferredoxin:NAD+ oxidoreductase subunit [Clostridiales bacterium]MDN5298419.1 H+/Na+-translocating ferredoxin:NAD+ oxidoreductase subunit [Clostridiales bacterium]
MGLLSFKGGIHPPHAKKATEHLPIVDYLEPKIVEIPLRQHIGAPCEAVVQKGDTVKMGQLIGKAPSFVSANVHSSVSGKVLDVKKMNTAYGFDVCVIIENDFKNELDESVKPKGDFTQMTGAEIIGIIKEAGLVGMGGAGFPTHVKLSPPPEKPIDTIILNGAECEPYLTCDHRLMLEQPEMIVMGLEILMKALSVSNGYIGIESNKPDAIESMTKAAKGTPIKVVGLHTKYPQGAEKQLIYACTNREVPSGGLPMDAGVVVNNVATSATIARVFKEGMPLIERICTVTGKAIKSPKNIRFKVGTSLKELIDFCDGYAETPGKLLLGGPMMGVAQASDQLPAMKNTSGILVFTKEDAKLPPATSCIKCGKCVSICPAFLEPIQISAYSLALNFDKAEKFGALDCIECGSCSFICPSKRPLLESIRVAKREILAKRRK